jgi:predicted PurR-regulated permease PerM
MTSRHSSRPFFYGVLVLTLLLVVYVLWPYAGEVAIGLLAAVLFRPLYDRVLGWRWTGGRELIATAVTLLAIALTVLVPLLVAVTLIVGQSQRLLTEVQSFDMEAGGERIRSAFAWLTQVSGQTAEELRARIDAGARTGLVRLAGGVLGLVGSIPELIIRFWVFLATLLYVLPNYHKLTTMLRRGLPLAPSISGRFLAMATLGLRSTVLSIVAVAGVQGLTTGVVLWLMSVPYVAIWTLLCTVAAIFPLGVLIVTVPIAAVMFAVGWLWQAIVLLLWTFVVVPNMDELIRPVLISRSTELHWALVMISAFGGAALFGVWGVVIGPVAMILAKTAVELYFAEYIEPEQTEAPTLVAPALRCDTAPSREMRR